jgi:branched-chain amino acid aminotransferase
MSSTSPEPIAWLNGETVPISAAKLSVFDMGIVLGASVTEMIRTIAHRPFRLDDHLERLERSLHAVGFSANKSRDELAAIVNDVVDHNRKLIPEGHDLGITLFVTAGLNLTYVGAAGLEAARQPTVCVHTFPLPFELWAKKLDEGQHLITPSIRHVPPDSLDPKIKSRSRLHWYLADQQAKLGDPTAGALVLDHAGNVAETSSGNFFIVRDGVICTPSHRTTLGGVSQQVVTELAGQIGIECVATDFQVYDVVNADEAFTSSTPYCLLPVVRVNGRPIGDGQPGPIIGKLLASWNDLVGIDIAEQIRRGAQERSEAT